eukprot:4095954-Alexandrium_andersonii.AAC.1
MDAVERTWAPVEAGSTPGGVPEHLSSALAKARSSLSRSRSRSKGAEASAAGEAGQRTRARGQDAVE